MDYVFSIYHRMHSNTCQYQVDESNTFADGSNILADFMTCMYEIDDEAEF
jgi:hypothetical protein